MWLYSQVCILAVIPCLWTAVIRTDHANGRSRRASVCYGELGCFAKDGKFYSLYRPLNLLPKSPIDIGIGYTLYRRGKASESLLATDVNSLKKSSFDPKKEIKIVVHGFIENGGVTWMRDMKDALLGAGDYNVILLDWGGGSFLLYTQATANTRVVGAQTALLIKNLQKAKGVNPQSFHIIGHSLGAHIAGYAGERLQNLGRISGMDPAEPYFKNTDPVVRLDHTDAMFVDVIHTDADSVLGSVALEGGFGLYQPVGHVDFYPNGGKDQPNCRNNIFKAIKLEGLYGGNKHVHVGVRRFVVCDHLRVLDLYTSSISQKPSCEFRGYPCSSFDTFKVGKCLTCGKQGCGIMGFHADKAIPPGGKFNQAYYLLTDGSRPFCVHHYKVTVTFDNPPSAKNERGNLFIYLEGTNGKTTQIALNEKIDRFHPGVSYVYFIGAANVGQLKSVDFIWKHKSCLICLTDWNFLGIRNPILHLKHVDVISLENQKKSSFCANPRKISNGQTTKIQVSTTKWCT